MDDLYTTYVTRLQKQEEAFKIEAVSPFQSVEIQTNPEGFEWERLGIGRKDDTEYHLHNQVEEIFPELLDFAALLSFIPLEKRKNWNLLRLLFVIKFSKSKQSQITEVVNNFVIKFIQEGNFNPDVEPGFLLNVCSSVPLNIILSDYLNIMVNLSSISAQFDTIFPIYYNFISKQVKTEVILQFLNKTLDLYHLFQRTRKERKDLLRIYQKRHFKSFFTTNYGKLGLSTFLTEIYLHPSTNSQNNLVTDLFGSLPFITQLFLQNGKIILYLVLPFEALPIFRDYLKRLQHVDLITHFYILPLKSYESNIYLNRNQNKNTYVNSFLPFSGRQWFLFNRPLQKLSNLIDTQYSQKIYYTPSCNELVITPIHLLIVLSKSEIFQNLYSFSNMRDFLSNAKNVISSKVKLREIPPKIQYIKKFSEAYQYFIKHGFFKEYDEFSCAINTLENYQSLHLGSNSRSLTFKFLKPGKKILAYAEKCKYPSPASLENYSSAEFFKEITQIISELRNTRQYSQYMIEKKINQLFSSQTLQENRGDQTIQFFYRDPRFFMVQIRTKSRMDWLESILFSNFLSIFDFANNYQILLSVDYWRIFIRFLTLTPIEWIEFLPGSVIPTPTHELIYFYNYTSQKWDFHKFSLSENCNQIASLVKKYLPSKSRTSPFHPVYDEKVAKLFQPFSLPKFMQGVFILRKDNEIAKKLLKSPSSYFDFLHHTFLVPSFDVDSTKKFLRENYTLTFAQIQRILTIMPKQQSEPSSDLELGKYLLIIQDYLFPCHPRVLSQDRLLTGLFCPGLQQVFFFGGVKEGVLVLEYFFPKSIVSSPEFKLQELLNKIEKKYLLKLRLLKINEEYRFISTEYLTSASLEVKQYQHVNVNKTDGRISHPSFVHIPQNMHYLRVSKHIPDAFWQVVGHPVTLFAHITCSASMTIPLVNMLMQLPIGQILVSEGVSPPLNVELVAWIHLAETIDEAMYQLIQILEEEKVRYFISPIIDYSIISDPNLKLPIKSTTNSSFKRL